MTGQVLPVYATTYVHADYGSGAVMGVPAHDDRDCAFALKNNIKSVQVIEERNDKLYLINSEQFTGLTKEEGQKEIVKQLEKSG